MAACAETTAGTIQPDHVARTLGDVAEEISDAHPAFFVLARKRETGQLAVTVGVEEEYVVAFGRAAPITVHGLRGE